MSAAAAKRAGALATVLERGYRPQWRSGCACPACHRSHWHVGTLSAECAFCGTALPKATAR